MRRPASAGAERRINSGYARKLVFAGRQRNSAISSKRIARSESATPAASLTWRLTRFEEKIGVAHVETLTYSQVTSGYTRSGAWPLIVRTDTASSGTDRAVYFNGSAGTSTVIRSR